MDYPQIYNDTVTVNLNDYSRSIIEEYIIDDISKMINDAIMCYFSSEFYHYERRQKWNLNNHTL